MTRARGPLSLAWNLATSSADYEPKATGLKLSAMTTPLGSDRGESHLVGLLWARLQAEDWTGASALLTDDFVAEWPATRERVTGKDDFIRIQREYPKPWGPIKVLQLIGDESLVAAEVSVPGAHENSVAPGSMSAGKARSCAPPSTG
jgi:hypothetical protein